jgi:hypothetical protein
MDWFDDVVLVATEGPKFTKAEIVANEVKRYVSEPLSTASGNTGMHSFSHWFFSERLQIIFSHNFFHFLNNSCVGFCLN